MTEPSCRRLAGRTAVVTGASRGIGLAVAERIVAEGGRVVITARRREALDDAVARLGEDHAVAVAGPADDPWHIEAAIATAVDTFGSLDLLVNNAGINPAYGPLLGLEDGAARKILGVNVLAALAWTRVAHAAWMGEHGGSVVNMSSVAGIRPAPGIAMYGASKATLIHLTEELAVELGPQVRVNSVAPGVVKTRFAAALYEGREDAVAAAYPLQRLGTPEDVAGAVAFLLSEDAAWVTGQLLVVDGGITLTGGA